VRIPRLILNVISCSLCVLDHVGQGVSIICIHAGVGIVDVFHKFKHVLRVKEAGGFCHSENMKQYTDGKGKVKKVENL
jgi:hypothetical protein